MFKKKSKKVFFIDFMVKSEARRTANIMRKALKDRGQANCLLVETDN